MVEIVKKHDHNRKVNQYFELNHIETAATLQIMLQQK